MPRSQDTGFRLREFRGYESAIAFLFDIVVTYLALHVALELRFPEFVPVGDRKEITQILPVLFLTRMGTLFAAGIYRRSFLYPRGFDTADMIQAWAAGTVLLAASVFFLHALETSRLVLVYEALGHLIGIFAWRIILRRVLQRRYLRAAHFGPKDQKDRLNRFLEIENWEYRIVRTLTSASETFEEGTIFVDAADLDPADLPRWKGRLVYIVSDVPEILIASTRAFDLGGMVLLEAGGAADRPASQIAKRTFDFTASLTALFLFLPVYVLLAALVKITSPGPIFFFHTRVGIDGRPFRMIKFRTMRHDAEGPGVTSRGDARITGFGKFLRHWSLDELPQLVNVLFGSMSLVGPRPEIPEAVERFPSWRRLVLATRPGVTGLVQVSGRDDLTEDEKARLDLYYTLNRSFEMDISIILRTFRSVFKYRGTA